MTLDQFVTRWQGRYLDYDSFSSIFGSWERLVTRLERGIINMNKTMLSTIGKIKILEPVVVVVAVDVVNNIFRGKFSTEKVFINKPISFSFPVGVSYTNHVFFLTLGGAVNKLTLFVALVVGKVYRTIVASKATFSRAIVAHTTTKSSLLRGWGLKLNRALFTKVFHITNYSTQCVQTI